MAVDWIAQAASYTGTDADRAVRVRAEGCPLAQATIVRQLIAYRAELRAEARHMIRPDIPAAEPVDRDSPVHLTLFVSDLHVPYHHTAACARLGELIADVKPDLLVLGGDVVDCYQVSHFRRDPSRLASVQDELDQAVDLLRPWVAASKRTVWLEGNHERRMQALRWEAVGIHDLRSIQWPALIHEAGLDVEYTDRPLVVGEGRARVHMIHGYKCNIHTAWHMLQREYPGQRMIQGHTHRPDYRAWTTDERTAVACVSGHMSDERTAGAYADNPHWTRGLVAVEHWDSMTQCVITPIPAHEASLCWRGKVYREP